MINKAEIIVEKFSQGITVRWRDIEGNLEPSKALAPIGAECDVIGKSIWKDVSEVLCDNTTDKVRIKLEYIPVED